MRRYANPLTVMLALAVVALTALTLVLAVALRREKHQPAAETVTHIVHVTVTGDADLVRVDYALPDRVIRHAPPGDEFVATGLRWIVATVASTNGQPVGCAVTIDGHTAATDNSPAGGPVLCVYPQPSIGVVV
ncbi:MAG TPA: hypothetical protein VHA75_07945 [Rugosimonospora sp.]|nr:hypothetical protein [Rugosimonospora sp.]